MPLNIFLTDIVNLNADASCLSSKWWLKMLKGGTNSYFYHWLKNYIDLNKKVSMGITGATLADISIHNPESIDLINKHRTIFEIILRPFAHDNSLIRSNEGFKLNLEVGIKTLKKEFGSYENYFLPPEFMLTNEQVYILMQQGIEGTFINATRFKNEIKDRLPDSPYYVKGLLGSELKCIPMYGELTHAYLNGIHFYNADDWNKLLNKREHVYFSWRDGESSFFLPDGNNREYRWLYNEDKNVERLFLSEALKWVEFDNNKNLKENHYHYYPVHSFTAWMKEFRMMGFINKVLKAEEKVQNYTPEEKALWLQVINSDILSSVEKDSPNIRIKQMKNDDMSSNFTIWRSERGLEGEEYLALLLNQIEDQNGIAIYLNKSSEYHIVKLNGRLQYLKQILK